MCGRIGSAGVKDNPMPVPRFGWVDLYDGVLCDRTPRSEANPFRGMPKRQEHSLQMPVACVEALRCCFPWQFAEGVKSLFVGPPRDHSNTR